MSYTLLELLGEETRKNLEEQIDHFDNLAKEGDINCKNMLIGANVLMTILEDDNFGFKGTKAYLKTLDRDQLEATISMAKKLLKEKTDIGMVDIFMVDGDEGVKWFEDENVAKEYYLKLAQKGLVDGYSRIIFEKRSIPIEEFSHYIDIKN